MYRKLVQELTPLRETTLAVLTSVTCDAFRFYDVEKYLMM